MGVPCATSAHGKAGIHMPVDGLDGGREAFRAAFDAGAGQPRIVMLVSPTCGLCLRGAEAVHRAVQEHARTADRVGCRDTIRAGRPGFALFGPGSDPRADLQGGSRARRGRVGLSVPYGSNAHWTDNQPPTPDFWMH